MIPATLIRYRYGRYSRNALDRDVDGIRALYDANGFRDVEVSSREIDDYQEAAQIAILIEIKEGPQWFVSALDLEGISEDDRAALEMILHSTAGQPYSDLDVALDRDAILDYYFNQGYPQAAFEFVSTPAAEGQRVDLKFVVTPGPREFVRNVVVTPRKNALDVVRSRIDLHAGDPLSQDKITGSQRRLYDLGIFARVDTALQNPDGATSRTRMCCIRSTKRASWTTNYGLVGEIGRIGGGTTSLECPGRHHRIQPALHIRCQPPEFSRHRPHHRSANPDLDLGTARAVDLFRAPV